MLERRVQMRLCFEENNVIEMRVINMSVNSEQSFEDNFDYFLEVFRKSNSDSLWKDTLVLDLIFDPLH